MDQTHLHLVITHLPIFGSILGAFVLAYGLWSKTDPTKVAAYYVFIITAVGAGIAYITGEAAEETVENIQGIAESVVEEHEEFAIFALVSILTLGVGSVIGAVATLKRSRLTTKIATVILLISLVSFALVARTGYLGGQIRHTEISDAPSGQVDSSEYESED